MTLRFGTDGVRGVANADLTPELVVALGRAAVRVMGLGPYVVGRDTRLSGPLLQSALSAGLAAEGASVIDVGVLPTPGVAALAAADGHAGAVVSASHNPFADNGIKLFAPGGVKLDDRLEARLEDELDEVLAGDGAGHVAVVGDSVGRVVDAQAVGRRRYADSMVAALGGRRLEGQSVVLDCANGAASFVAPEVLRALGSEVHTLHDGPDGTNINEGCGSTHPEDLQAAVSRSGADVGLGFDGDADRVLAVDHRGRVVDGDQLIAICALDMQSRGELAGDTVVVTVMTNLGFRLAMAEHDINVVETPVGDRAVLDALERGGWSLGGEQSGHVVFPGLATTGDGLLTGLRVLDAMQRSGRTLEELAAVMTRLPQVLRNVAVAPGHRLDEGSELRAAVSALEAELQGRGRVLVRPSGTEPVVRVMVEAPTIEEAEAAADRLARAVTVVGPTPAKP